MKCSVCKKNIEMTFLKKILGAFVKDEKGKRHPVCSNCQRVLKHKEDILKSI